MILLTDRLNLSQPLFESLSTIEPCTTLRLDGVLKTREKHTTLVCDVDLHTKANLAATKAALARCRMSDISHIAPILYLSRDERALDRAAEISATAVLPSRASHAQVIFTIRRLIEAGSIESRKSSLNPTPAAIARIREAGSLFADVLDTAQRGRALSMETLERGGDAIIAAVGGGRIGPWLDAVQAYDDLTYQHCLLVAGLATAFANHLGFSLTGQSLIAQAGLLHDIGKVRIPAHIINKPGRLTAEEMAVVRRHPAIGHDMLIDQGGFDLRKLDIVLHHHEFIDGSGYPHGLKGDQISPLVRLMTICDIFAALIERRSYRSPMSLVDAMSIILGMNGKLDPSLLVAFEGFVRRA